METPDESPGGQLNYLWLKKVKDCERCDLHASRIHGVFGEGSSTADVMFVGEGPGHMEDRLGRPFVGRSGGLLDKLCSDVGLGRNDVYVCNVVKCRPPENRNPYPEEITQCSKFLYAQIFVVKPKVIVTLGKVAAQLLTDLDHHMGEFMDGTWLYNNKKTGQEIPVCCLFHPAYILRQMQGNETTEHQMYQDALAGLRKALRVRDGGGELPEEDSSDDDEESPEPEADILSMFGVEE